MISALAVAWCCIGWLAWIAVSVRMHYLAKRGHQRDFRPLTEFVAATVFGGLYAVGVVVAAMTGEL